MHILFTQGENENFNKIIKYLEKRKEVSLIEILNSNEDNLYLRILTKDVGSILEF